MLNWKKWQQWDCGGSVALSGAVVDVIYGSWISNYLCNQYLSPLTLWVRIPLRLGVLDTTLCDKICQLLATGQWFSPGTPAFSTNKTDHHNITEIWLKVALNTINQPTIFYKFINASSEISWSIRPHTCISTFYSCIRRHFKTF